MSDELEDFEAFLKDDFSPIEFSNELLLATNSSVDSSLDLTTPSKRLGFDLIEIDKRINKLTSDNYEVLYKELTKIDNVKSSLGVVQPSLKDLNSSFVKLEDEILKPYNESIELHDALKKIHTTSILLRSVQFFLYLVQNLEESFANLDGTKGLIKLVKNFQQLKSHMHNNSVFLKGLKLIKEYEMIFQKHELKIQDVLLQDLKKISTLSDSSINNLIIAFNNFNHDLMEKQILEFINNQVSISSNNLIKTLTNPRNFPNILSDILEQARYITIIQYYLLQNQISITNKNLISIFYRDLAKFFELNLKKIYNKGGPVSKNLKNYQSLIEESIKENVIKSDFNGILKKDGLEVRMMLNSINCLNNTRR